MKPFWENGSMVAKILKIIKKKKKILVAATKNIGMKFSKKIWKSHFEVLKLGLQQHPTYQCFVDENW